LVCQGEKYKFKRHLIRKNEDEGHRLWEENAFYAKDGKKCAKKAFAIQWLYRFDYIFDGIVFSIFVFCGPSFYIGGGFGSAFAASRKENIEKMQTFVSICFRGTYRKCGFGRAFADLFFDLANDRRAG
jgi:hypothetical protein